MEIKQYFIENYINKFSENDYIGVEIEMPIINLNSPYIVNSKVIEGLFSTFLDNEEFKIENYDNENIAHLSANIKVFSTGRSREKEIPEKKSSFTSFLIAFFTIVAYLKSNTRT